MSDPPEIAKAITQDHENPVYLPGISLTPALTAGTDPAEALSGADLVVSRRHGVEMPITEVVAAVIRDGLPVREAAAVLASRSAKPEWYGV